MTTCDVVAERVALGEPLGDAAEHAERCAKCRSLVALAAELGALHGEADPGLGFSARMTARAQHRVVVRRRRRIAAGMAAVVAAAAVAAVVITRTPNPSNAPALTTNPPDPTQQPATSSHDETKHDKDRNDVDEDVRALVQLADTDGAQHTTAHWKRIQRPLAPYRALLRGVDP